MFTQNDPPKALPSGDGIPFTIPPGPAPGVAEELGVADCILRRVGTGVVGPRVEGARIGL